MLFSSVIQKLALRLSERIITLTFVCHILKRNTSKDSRHLPCAIRCRHAGRKISLLLLHSIVLSRNSKQATGVRTRGSHRSPAVAEQSQPRLTSTATCLLLDKKHLNQTDPELALTQWVVKRGIQIAG